MLEFAVELWELQMRSGRAFLLEHPVSATSWEIGGLKRLYETNGVYEGVFDMCRYGMVNQDEQGSGLVRKTTRILSNDEEVAACLRARCEAGHRHVQLISGRAKAAANYPTDMCRAIIKGFDVWRKRLSTGGAPLIMEFARADLRSRWGV